MDSKTQDNLFGDLFNVDNWEDEYVGMPEYNNIDQEDPLITAKFKFRSKDDFLKFKELVQKHIFNGEKVFDGEQTENKKQSWFPHLEKPSKYVYVSKKKEYYPRFPVYIISKGRWEKGKRLTSNYFESVAIDYKIVVEEQEYDNYASVIDEDKILILPKKYQKEYDTFWDRKRVKNKTGSGAARNYCWEHSIENGYDYHWVFDDNISGIERFNKNMQVKCKTATPMYIMEDFVLRYTNIVQAGMGYTMFFPRNRFRPPLTLNTRIYSNHLIKNDIPFRWRGTYNEDTDLSLRILKSGLCTMQFNMFLIDKMATQRIQGGYTEEFYAKEGTLDKSQMLVDMHPDVTKLSTRWNRDHHYVNYNKFKANKLIKTKKHKAKNINEYDLYLKKIK